MNNIAEISEVFRQSYEFLGGELEKKFLGVQTNYISSIGGGVDIKWNGSYALCSSTPGQIQYGGFKRALAKKSGDMIRDRVRILYLLFLWG